MQIDKESCSLSMTQPEINITLLSNNVFQDDQKELNTNLFHCTITKALNLHFQLLNQMIRKSHHDDVIQGRESD